MPLLPLTFATRLPDSFAFTTRSTVRCSLSLLVTRMQVAFPLLYRSVSSAPAGWIFFDEISSCTHRRSAVAAAQGGRLPALHRFVSALQVLLLCHACVAAVERLSKSCHVLSEAAADSTPTARRNSRRYAATSHTFAIAHDLCTKGTSYPL